MPLLKKLFLSDNGKAIAVHMVKTVLGAKDESGRQKMEEVKGGDFNVNADVIIMALGFDPVVPGFLAENGIAVNNWGGIVIDDQLSNHNARYLCWR